MTTGEQEGSAVRKRYEARAWRDVGLTPADAQRLADEHARLRAQASRAADVIDLEERCRLMRSIAAAYGRLYLSSPDRFVWMGFAAIAVNDGVAPTSALAALAARHLQPLAAARDAARPWELAEGGVKASFEANYAIFADLYWVHLAYRDGGLDLLRALHHEGALDGALLEGFTLVDEGDVVAGNHLLFRREQHAAVTPVFTKYRDAMSVATRLGLIVVPNAVLKESCAEMGRSPAFSDTHDEDESYGPFSVRWRWLTACAWEPLVRLHEARDGRALLEAEVRRAVAGAPEPLRRRARWALRSLAARLSPEAPRLIAAALG